MTTAIKSSQNWQQQTLRKPITLTGIGLHSGRQVSVLIRPQPAGTGIWFQRRDLEPQTNLIRALWCNVSSTRLSTTLTNTAGNSVGTVEHLLAALQGCGVDNALIELDGPEVPIMDGSALPFVTAIQHSGIRQQQHARQFIEILRPVYVTADDKIALLMPFPGTRLSIDIDFPHPAIGSQHLSMGLNQDSFRRLLAPARSFGFLDQVAHLQTRGLAQGGSMHNAIVFDQHGVLNPGGLRFANECVRHKLLDCVGDLALAGGPVLGYFYSRKPGHELNNLLLQNLFAQTDAWRFSHHQTVSDKHPVIRQTACRTLSRHAL